MPKVTINGAEIEVENGLTVLQACEIAGVDVPRFCYHERLTIAGNCRMCLVEMEKSPKPVASCAMPVADGQVIKTDTPMVKKAREGVMELLLINHPLDCPICDQGGECDLQDQSLYFGKGESRFHENKRAVKDKYMGPLVKTQMTRCIHCTRCVRFATEVAGVQEIGALGRGENMEITTYLEKSLTSELSANVIDLCPVGALTSKPYAFSARPWELRKTESIDVMDAVGSNIRVDARGNQVMRVLPRNNDDVNEEWISDKTRFAVDGLIKRRLDKPYVRKNGKLVEASWAEAFAAISARLKSTAPEKVAAIAGDLVDAESVFALKSLLDTLGVSNYDCRGDGAWIDPGNRAGYLFNTGIAGIEQADALLIIGSNPRLEAPVLNARIRKRWLRGGFAVANIGPAADLTYKVEQLGNDPALVDQIKNGTHPFADVLKSAQRPMLILGQGALARRDGNKVQGAARAIAEAYELVKDGWNGFNLLHTAAGRVGALDLGFSKGYAGAILSAAGKGELDMVFLLGADEIDAEKLKDVFVVYQGTHGDRGVKHADVILPGAAYTEKSGLYVNTEGRVQMANRATFPPGDAREDWTILRALSDVVGHRLPFDTLAQLRAAMFQAVPHLAAIDQITPAAWGAFGATGELAADPFVSTIGDFYQTNPIARASETMRECSELKNGVTEGATGTHG